MILESYPNGTQAQICQAEKNDKYIILYLFLQNNLIKVGAGQFEYHLKVSLNSPAKSLSLLAGLFSDILCDALLRFDRFVVCFVFRTPTRP